MGSIPITRSRKNGVVVNIQYYRTKKPSIKFGLSAAGRELISGSLRGLPQRDQTLALVLPIRGNTLGKFRDAHIAQSVEHFLGKEEVTGSNPVVGSRVQGVAVPFNELEKR